MEQLTDWAALWRELVECRARGLGGDGGQIDQDDPWAGKAREFNERVQRRWSGPDSSRQFVSSRVEPGTTVLDIGAGTGAWSILLAPKAARVTAIDASPAMASVMRENLANGGVTNVDVVEGSWPDVSVEPHDYSLCAHAMYGSPDLPAFVEAMMRATRRTCFLMLRAPVTGGIMAQAAMRLWGQPHDSPNFPIAYNVLLQMGLTPNVLMESGPAGSGGLWDARTSASLDEALARMKRHFGLADSADYDAYFLDLLGRRLEQRDGPYVWERDMRSALVYWDVT
jgi:SAM-dependent methyltransferase